MIIPKTRLVQNVNRDLSDNATGDISPYDIRHNLLDVIDSIHLLTKDQNIESLNVGTPDLRNSRLGLKALEKMTLDGYSSTDNVAVGFSALKSSYRTQRNVAVGSFALSCNIHGNGNVAIGYNSIAANTTGYSNVGLGNHTLNSNKTGNFNIAIGNAAGYYIDNDDSYKFFLASHPIDEAYIDGESNTYGEDYICQHPDGEAFTPLLYGDLQSNVLGVNTRKLDTSSVGVLQTAGNITPIASNTHSLGHVTRYWEALYSNNLRFPNNASVTYRPDLANHVGVKAHLFPYTGSAFNLGGPDDRWNRGYFEEIYSYYLTALQKTFFANKTLYLASSGEWSIDGGGPSSLYEYFPCPNAPEIVPMLSEADAVGGGFVLQSKEGSWNFTFQNSDDGCGTRRRWQSNIGLELQDDNFISSNSYISNTSTRCNGIHMSGDVIFFGERDQYKASSTIAGNGHVNYYAPSDGADSTYIVTYNGYNNTTNVATRYINDSKTKTQSFDGFDMISGFEQIYIDDNNSQDRFVTRSFNNSSFSTNHTTLLKNSPNGACFGVNNFGRGGESIYPETVFNVRSRTDAIARISAETDANVIASLELVSPQNCLNSGISLNYVQHSGCFNLDHYNNFEKTSVIHSSGEVLGIFNDSPQAMLSVGCSSHNNATIAMYERSSAPNSGDMYGQIYVKPSVAPSQTQALFFLDDEGNEFKLVRNINNPIDGLVWSDNKNTFGGLCPNVRGDTPNAYHNTGFGYHTLYNISTGDSNTAYGSEAASTITTGSNNVAIGFEALRSVGNGKISNNIVIGCHRIGKNVDNDYNFLLGETDDNLLFEAKLGPQASQKHLYMPDGKITLYGTGKTEGLHLSNNTISVQDFGGSDNAENKLKIKFAGNNENDLMILDHNADAMNASSNYKQHEVARPSAELKGDLKLLGGIAFRDGSFLEGAGVLGEIPGIKNRLEDIFIEGHALGDIDYATNINSPSVGFIRDVNNKNFTITNRDKNSRIKQGDYVIALKMGDNTYRPIWISNESSVCTCCTR